MSGVNVGVSKRPTRRPALGTNIRPSWLKPRILGPIEIAGALYRIRDRAMRVNRRFAAVRPLAIRPRVARSAVKNGVVQMAVGGDDAAVFGERAAVGEIERFAVEIGDSAAGFFDDDRAGGLVPDFFAVVGARRGEQAQHHVAFAGGEDGVLGLAIHADRRFG